MSNLDVNLETLNEALREATYAYQRAKRDLSEANAFGVKEWRQVAFRQLNHCRRELRRACRLTRKVIY